MTPNLPRRSPRASNWESSPNTTFGIPTPGDYAPAAVPLTVHRQVVAELEEAQAMIQDLTTENQALQQQHQALYQEIQRVQAAMAHLTTIAQIPPGNDACPQVIPLIRRPAQTPTIAPTDLAITKPTQALAPLAQPWDPEPHPEDIIAPNWHLGWLLLTLFLIVVTGFGTGFLVVRPFLETPTHTPASPEVSQPHNRSPDP